MAKILIADDEKDFLMMLEARLKSRGHEIITAADGEEALAKARAARPDLIILDIVMPKMDGTSAARKLREDEATRAVPVIFLTALKTKEEQARQGPESSYPMFAKPFEPEELFAKVDEILAGSGGITVKFLVVDRSAVMRKKIVDTIFEGKVFQAANAEMLEAGDGTAAFEAFEKKRPHVVLANCDLPGQSGVDLARRIRVADARIPILMVITEGQQNLIDGILKEGVATDYVIKPVSTGVIETKLLKAFQALKTKGEGNAL